MQHMNGNLPGCGSSIPERVVERLTSAPFYCRKCSTANSVRTENSIQFNSIDLQNTFKTAVADQKTVQMRGIEIKKVAQNGVA